MPSPKLNRGMPCSNMIEVNDLCKASKTSAPENIYENTPIVLYRTHASNIHVQYRGNTNSYDHQEYNVLLKETTQITLIEELSKHSYFFLQ